MFGQDDKNKQNAINKHGEFETLLGIVILIGLVPVVVWAAYLLTAAIVTFGIIQTVVLLAVIILIVYTIITVSFGSLAKNCNASDAVTLLFNDLASAWRFTRSDAPLPSPEADLLLLSTPLPERPRTDLCYERRRIRCGILTTYYRTVSVRVRDRLAEEHLIKWLVIVNDRNAAQARQACRQGQALRLSKKQVSDKKTPPPWLDEL